MSEREILFKLIEFSGGDYLKYIGQRMVIRMISRMKTENVESIHDVERFDAYHMLIRDLEDFIGYESEQKEYQAKNKEKNNG